MSVTSMEIVPFVGLGGLRFGMARADIHRMLGPGFFPFRKTAAASQETDDYRDVGLHLHYDEGYRLEFAEVFPPCRPHYRGVELIGPDLGAVVRALGDAGHQPVLDGDALYYEELGISLYCEFGTIEGVAVNRRGYYEERSV